jgi:hypothetical protein
MDGMNDMGGGEAETAPAAPPSPTSESDGKNTVMLSADHFPSGMAPKDGDKLTFCVTGKPDEEGNVSGYFEPAAGGNKGEGMDEWANDFRKSMSPTAPGEEAQ